MTTRFATPDEVARWDDFLVQNPDGGNVFQSMRLAESKRGNNWTPRYIFIDTLAVTVLEKSVKVLGNYWYLPKGPGVLNVNQLLSLLQSLQQFALAQCVFAVKIEPEVLDTTETKTQLLKAGLIKTNAVQPNSSTVVIDLAPSLDEIMADFNQKGRHAMHRAERDGVIETTVVGNGLTEALVKAGVDPKFLAASKALLRGQVKLKRNEDGSRTAVVDTDLGEIEVAQYVDNWSKSDEGKAFVTKPAGGGASGSGDKSKQEGNPWLAGTPALRRLSLMSR